MPLLSPLSLLPPPTAPGLVKPLLPPSLFKPPSLVRHGSPDWTGRDRTEPNQIAATTASVDAAIVDAAAATAYVGAAPATTKGAATTLHS